MSLVQDVLNALISLETTGTGTIPAQTQDTEVHVFGQDIVVETTESVTLKKK